MSKLHSNQTVSREKAEQIIKDMFDKWDTNRFNILMGIRDDLVTERRKRE